MENKKGRVFFASLFAPKACACSSLVEETLGEQHQEVIAEEQKQAEAPKTNTVDRQECLCADNCQ